MRFRSRIECGMTVREVSGNTNRLPLTTNRC